MRYAQIREMDISNGEGIGVSLFVQGCPYHCVGCFNSETWDFHKGKEWTEEAQVSFFSYIEKPYIKRVSFLGGEPLCEQNRVTVTDLIKKIRYWYPTKKIWVWTGGLWENSKEFELMRYIDILVDGRFQLSQKDLNLKFRGSKNQRVIDVQKSLLQNKPILYLQ